MSQESDGEFVYAVLLHLTHYDDAWLKGKETESRFDRGLMEELIDLSADTGLNTVIFDIADAVEYNSHPELKRPYSVPMQELAELAGRARKQGLEVIPKLNFAKSERYWHNWWFRPYRELPDDDEYFEHAWKLIDELLQAVGPTRRFHVGMDEDTLRDADAYCEVIEKLHAGLAQRGCQTVIWSDSCYDWGEPRNSILETAFQRLPRDIILALWNYRSARLVHPFDMLRTGPELVERFVEMGYPVWGASCEVDFAKYPEMVVRHDESVARAWAEAVRAKAGSGMLATLWFPVQPEHRSDWRDVILSSARAFGLRD